MRIKILYGLFAVLILSVCGTDKQSAHNKTHAFDNETDGTALLINKWTVSSVIRQTINEVCNTCPTINFNRNNTAVLQFPNNRTENYSWRITSDTLTLLCTSFTQTNSTTPYFLEFKYKMKYQSEKDFLELKLSPNKDRIYVLRR